ncbi:MAG TPA: class I SAM-dependent methyltransferase, partial [Candidatus Binatia bacterium]|nr:class I SAM-dependent methyltransferase [Candidatus Binatia bacterium]
MQNDDFVHWFEALEKRHLANLSFAEVRRAVQALSSLYVERRSRLGNVSPLGSAGKRAAFALFFGPLHFLLVREIVRALGARVKRNAAILDLGCGTGPAGAAWSLELNREPGLIGVDRNPWALRECKWTYQQLRLRGSTRALDLAAVRIPAHTAVIAA